MPYDTVEESGLLDASQLSAPAPYRSRTLRRQVTLLVLTLAVVVIPNLLAFAADLLEY